MHAAGTFTVKVHPEPPYSDEGGVALSRVRVDKRFEGPIDATSVVDMLAVRGAVDGAGAYVATERVVGSVDGKRGSFTVLHRGLRRPGEQSLELVLAPGSGTGELAGIEGTMTIVIEGGVHRYTLDYTLP